MNKEASLTCKTKKRDWAQTEERLFRRFIRKGQPQFYVKDTQITQTETENRHTYIQCHRTALINHPGVRGDFAYTNHRSKVSR